MKTLVILSIFLLSAIDCSAQSGGILSIKSGGKITVDSVLLGEKVCRQDTLINVGDSDVIITHIIIYDYQLIMTGGGDDVLIGVPSLPFALKPQERLQLSYCVTQRYEGPDTVLLLISTNTNGKFQHLVDSLFVYADTSCASASPQELFSNTIVSADDPLTLCDTIKNCGNLPTIYHTTISGTGANTYYVSPKSSATIPHDGFAIFCVTFKPTHKGTEEAILNISLTNSSITIPLHGIGASSSVFQESTNDGFNLGQIFPNPSAGIIRFSYVIPAESEIHIYLSDVKGSAVKIITNGRVSKGEHSVTFDASDIPSGSYILSLESGNVRLIRELIITK